MTTLPYPTSQYPNLTPLNTRILPPSREYWVATISRLLKSIGLFCRISSVL